MDSSSASNAVPSDLDALATLLGVKGPLRLVPQGPTPKAHIILRRDFARDDESSDGESSNVARFSFVAGKKITVNKGQPLLFAVASPKDRDGKTLLGKDNTFILEGTIDENPYESDEDEVERIKRKQILRKMRQGTKGTALPPKMRKSFGGRTTYESFAETYLQHKPSSSLGFVGYPVANEKPRVFATVEVQTDPVSSASPTVEESSAPRESDIVEEATKSPVQLPSPVSADHAREVIPGSIAQAGTEEIDEYSRVERSLSPMDLSSASSSPAASPISKSQPLPEINITTVPDATDAALSSNAPNAGVMPEADAHVSANSPLRDLPSSPLSSPPADRSLSEKVVESEIEPSEASKLKSPTPSQNPVRVPTPPLPSVQNDTIPTKVDIPDMKKGYINPTASSPRPASEELVIKKELVSQFQQISENAVASSSKSSAHARNQDTSADIASVAVHDSQQPTRPVSHLSARAQEKQPAFNPPPKQPAACSSTLMANSSTIPRSSSPPPDPKELVYIPSGSSSNPLGIRPSSGRPVPVPASSFKPSKPVPIGPRSLIANGWGTVPTKRPLVVGTNWSAVKGSSSSSNSSNGVLSTSTSASSAASFISPIPPPLAATASTSSGNKAIMSQIMRYASPSPPPPPPQVAPPLPESTPPPPPIALSSSQSSTDMPRWKRISPVDDKKIDSVKKETTAPAESAKPSDIAKPSAAVEAEGKEATPSRSSSASSSASLKRSHDSATASLEEYFNKQVQSLTPNPSKKPRTMAPIHPLTPTFVPATATAIASVSTINSLASIPTGPAALSSSHNPLAMPSTSASAPVATQKASSLTHPLPPKPVISVSSSSYRPPAKRERERERDRDRERERSPEPIETKRPPAVRTDWPPTNCSADYQLQPHGSNTDLAIQKITISSDGSLIALTCADRTLRIWENKISAIEIARLSHNSALASVCWMEGDSGVMTLTADGTISTWTRNGKEWRFTKLLSVPDASNMSATEMPCLAYVKDRIAVATHASVNVWLLINGTWKQQREIKRSGVSVVKFIQDGAAIVGGCRDGAIWICEVPNGTMRAHCFFPKAVTSIDVHPSGSYLLVAVEGGQAHLLTMKESMGTVEHTYTSEKVQNQALKQKGFPAVFATRGQAILYGTVNGCALVWDRKKCQIVYGLKHPEGDRVLAAATFDGRPGVEGLMITGTKQGRLFWWPQPVAAAASR